MPKYLTVHTIACITRQNLKKLAERLQQDEQVELLRMVADTIEGAAICEFAAPSRDVLMAYLSRNHMHTDRLLHAELQFP